MQIRRMKQSDVIAVTRLHRNTIRTVNAKHYTKQQIAAWSGRIHASWVCEHFDSEQRFVAVVNGEIAGFMNMSKNGKILQALYIRKKYIGRGVGTALFKKAEHIIRVSGGRRMQVDATLTAQAFYEKQGLRVIARTATRINGEDIPSLKMAKRL